MTALKLTMTREVTPEEVDDLIDLVDFSRSPWFKSINTIIGGTSYLVTHENADRQYADHTGPLRTPVDAQELLNTIKEVQPKLCCFSSIMAGDFYGGELGHLCANDADIILQTAVFGRIVFG